MNRVSYHRQLFLSGQPAGLPHIQNRPCRNDTEAECPQGFSSWGHEDKSFEDIIHKDGFFAKEFKIQDNTKGMFKEFKYKDIYEVSEKFKMPFENSGIMKDGKINFQNWKDDGYEKIRWLWLVLRWM